MNIKIVSALTRAIPRSGPSKPPARLTALMMVRAKIMIPVKMRPEFVSLRIILKVGPVSLTCEKSYEESWRSVESQR